MTTPTHIVANLALLGRKLKPELNKWLLLGALLPDAGAYIFFVIQRIQQVPSDIMWGVNYFSEEWQPLFSILNSIPIFLILLLIGVKKKVEWLKALSSAVLLHIFLDFFLHNDDAYSHFFPISDFRFQSPVSYWDPNHYGNLFQPIEIIFFVICSFFAYKILKNKSSRVILVIFSLSYLLLIIVGRSLFRYFF